MFNVELFQYLNAGPHLGVIPRWTATLVAEGLGGLVAMALLAFVLTDRRARRRALPELLLSVVLSLTVAKLIEHFWPQPRPFALGLGNQYLPHGSTAGFPSSHTTFVMALAISSCLLPSLRRFGLPLAVAGALVGWSRVFLGVHFPYDIAAAVPVAASGALLSHGMLAAVRKSERAAGPPRAAAAQPSRS